MAIKLEPDLSSAYFNKGIYYIDVKNYKCALDNIDTAVLLEPNDAFNIENRGELFYFCLKNKKSACVDWEKAAALGNSKAQDELRKYCK